MDIQCSASFSDWSDVDYELSEYQIRKFRRYFNFFDTNADGAIDWKDVQLLNHKITAWTGWSTNDSNRHILEDLHRNFFDCLNEESSDNDCGAVKSSRDSRVDLDRWLSMWTSVTKDAKSMKDLPYWLQILPSLFFVIVDRDKDGVISKQELKNFYQHFDLVVSNVDQYVGKAYNAMTANGDFVLDRELYRLIFSSFILCRNRHGPGKYIIGYCDPEFECLPFRLEDDCQELDEENERSSNGSSTRQFGCSLPRVINYWPSTKII